MTRTREEIHEERRRLKGEFGSLYGEVTALLFRHDPIGINSEVNPDEYEPEVGTILPRLAGCTSPDDVLSVVHEEFVRWFNGEHTAGLRERYREIANEIWELWVRYQGKTG